MSPRSSLIVSHQVSHPYTTPVWLSNLKFVGSRSVFIWNINFAAHWTYPPQRRPPPPSPATCYACWEDGIYVVWGIVFWGLDFIRLVYNRTYSRKLMRHVSKLCAELLSCPFVRIEQSGCHWTACCQIWFANFMEMCWSDLRFLQDGQTNVHFMCAVFLWSKRSAVDALDIVWRHVQHTNCMAWRNNVPCILVLSTFLCNYWFSLCDFQDT